MSSEVAVISLPVLEQDPVSSKQPQADHSPVADAEVAADEKPAAVLMEEIKQTIIMSQATTTATLTGKTTSDSEDLSEHVPESVSESGAVTTPPYEVMSNCALYFNPLKYKIRKWLEFCLQISAININFVFCKV